MVMTFIDRRTGGLGLVVVNSSVVNLVVISVGVVVEVEEVLMIVVVRVVFAVLDA